MSDDVAPPGSLLADPSLCESVIWTRSGSFDGRPARDLLNPGDPLLGDEDGVPYVAIARRIRRRPAQVDRKSMPSGLSQRRREPRFRAVEDRVWIQWWSRGEFNGLSARLVNVSRSGAMIVVSVLLTEGQALRLYLEEPAPAVSIEARVLGALEGNNGLHQIRLAFPCECPESFFEAAANGFEAWLARE